MDDHILRGVMMAEGVRYFLYFVGYPGVNKEHPSGGAPPEFSREVEQAFRFSSYKAADWLKAGDWRVKEFEAVSLEFARTNLVPTAPTTDEEQASS